ncbi:MAG: hypothetical protein KJ017_00165 [Alphaproteobacteria bacterium]|nr:hypothetical protein [Alphaproteobacteria bacterium]
MLTPADTLRAIFRTLSGGGLRLRKAPTAKIDQQVLREVFAPAQSLKGTVSKTAVPSKPAARRGTLRFVPRTPKK